MPMKALLILFLSPALCRCLYCLLVEQRCQLPWGSGVGIHTPLQPILLSEMYPSDFFVGGVWLT